MKVNNSKSNIQASKNIRQYQSQRQSFRVTNSIVSDEIMKICYNVCQSEGRIAT